MFWLKINLVEQKIDWKIRKLNFEISGLRLYLVLYIWLTSKWYMGGIINANLISFIAIHMYPLRCNIEGKAIVYTNDDVTLAVGTVGGTHGLTIAKSGNVITFKHADTSTQGNVNNSGRTYIQDISLDAYGHITNISSASESDQDTLNVVSLSND